MSEVQSISEALPALMSCGPLAVRRRQGNKWPTRIAKALKTLRMVRDTWGGYGWTCKRCGHNDYSIHDM